MCSMPSSRRDTPSTRQLTKSGRELADLRPQRGSSAQRYSRYSEKSSRYATQRHKRANKKKIVTGILIGVLALLVAGGTAVFAFFAWMNNSLHEGLDLEGINAVTTDRAKPEDPFWLLLLGTDDHMEDEVPRSDSIILVRIDPKEQTAALVSIPRDTRIEIPDYGMQKINAAYALGVTEQANGHSGPEFAITAVSSLCNVGIAGFAQIDINGFVALVDAIGGVEVEVLMDISDYEAGDVDVHAGLQRLDGQHAIVFVRSRDYDIGDYQRQANQRVFLQALAREILQKDPLTVVNAISKICEMTSTNFDIATLGNIATSMQGMEEYNVHTYSLPCTSDMIDGISYEIPDMESIRQLMALLDKGQFPDPDEIGLTRQGKTPEFDGQSGAAAPDMSGGGQTGINTSAYVVDTRNGGGIPGAAAAISDMLALAGYQQGDVGNTNSMVYTETLVVYDDEASRLAAEDICLRIGYGRAIPSLGRYLFEGNILVVVGSDFK
jgi:LCP family protein required for cell wall assembly